jgi:hypothetical protein
MIGGTGEAVGASGCAAALPSTRNDSTGAASASGAPGGGVVHGALGDPRRRGIIMDPVGFDAFTQALVRALEADDRVLGLIALGSTADPGLRDAYSDHDFWLVVATGTEPQFLADLAWLPRPAADRLAVVRFGTRGVSILYTDRHAMEIAVFTEASLAGQPTDRYAILLDRTGLASRLPTLVTTARTRRAEKDRWPDAMANLAMLVWTGVQRHRRGEFLASQKYLRYHAVEAVLAVAQAAGRLEHPATNFLDPWRRLERVNPRLAAGLLSSFSQPVPMAGRTLLDVAEMELRPFAPEQGWEAVATVRRWLE